MRINRTLFLPLNILASDNRPIATGFSYSKTVAEYLEGTPVAYNHVIDITDNVDPMSDSVLGTFTGSTMPSIISYNNVADVQSVTNDLNTYEKWLESRATVRIEMSSIAHEFQVYRTNDSLLSDANTKLHDNLYYQAFAYSLISNQDLREYRGSIDLIHPAGIKFHAILTKMFNSDETGNIAFDILAAVDTFFWNETVDISDVYSKHVLKMLATDPGNPDTFTTFIVAEENIQWKQVIKPLAHAFIATDAETKHLLKPFVAPHILYDGVTTDIDIVTMASAIDSKQVLKPLVDFPETIDSIHDFMVDKSLTDSSVATETHAILSEKIFSDSLVDSINTTDGTPVREAESRYNITEYAVNSVDSYFYSGIALTIS